MDNKDLKFVHQFLIDHKFEDTAGALIAEAAIKDSKNFEVLTDNESNTYFYSQLMLHLKTGDWRKFFQLWNCLIPENVKETKDYKILMLNLHVYFALLPKHILLQHCYIEEDAAQSIKSLSERDMKNSNFKDLEKEISMTEIEKNMIASMEQLQIFLNTTGKELEDDTQLRPFFALPFIEDPHAEPFLSKVFEKYWIDELIENLNKFLETYRQNPSCLSHDSKNSNKCLSDRALVLEKIRNDSMNKIATKNKVSIIPNDRNIPIFLEENEVKEQETLWSDTKFNKKSRSVQATFVNYSREESGSSYFVKNNTKLVQCLQELAITKSHLCTVHSNYEKLKLRFHKLHADYHKLMGIARVLTTALENSVKGEIIDFQTMLENCIKIFPDLFNQNVRDSLHCITELQLNKSYSDMKLEHSVSYVISIPPKLLDFKKIKLHLINATIKTKLLLLQALRRKITCSQLEERDEVVHEYISKDLIGLHGQIASYNGKSILPHLLTPENIVIPHPLQQSATRLLNALASFRCGRDYLSFDSTVVDMVFKCLNSTCDNDVDTFTFNMMIAMLQKLSLRKQQRLYMIETGLVEWLIRHLHNQCRVMDSYRLEYATALLMNLSLHKMAQRRASSMASLLISTLTALLLIDHASALPYINGALNNFLTNHVINEEAKKMKFSSVLEEYGKHKTGEIRKDLDHILKIYRGEITIKTENEELTDNDNEEFDVIENELEDNDPVKNSPGELFGESLLAACYTILLQNTEEKNNTTDGSSFEQFQIDAVNSVSYNDQQVKNVYYDHESIPYGKTVVRQVKNVNETENKNNTVIEVPFKKTALNSALQSNIPRLDSFSIKDPYVCNKITNESRNISFNDINMTISSKPFHEDYKQTEPTTKLNVPKKHYKNIMTNTSPQLNVIMERSNTMNDNKFTNHFSGINLQEQFKNISNNRENKNKSLENTRGNILNTVYYNAYKGSAVYLYENPSSKGSSRTNITSSLFLGVEDEDDSVTKKFSSIASL